MKNKVFLIQRILGYVLGFLLFYEPFMFFSKFTANFIEETQFTSIHVPCVRIPLANIITGEWQYSGPTSLLFCLLLAVVSVWLGPVFCGKLCPAGAFGEGLSNILPDKYKIDWSKFLPILPLRYGFFAGFLFSAWLGLGVPCMYCNYYSLEIFVNYFVTGMLLSSVPSLIATFVLAYFVLGLFTKGGRGYCNFFCPVGTYCSSFHLLGQYLPGPLKMSVNRSKCVGCTKCAKLCPMRTITIVDRKAHINISRCITCQVCQKACPMQAIKYQSNIIKEEA